MVRACAHETAGRRQYPKHNPPNNMRLTMARNRRSFIIPKYMGLAAVGALAAVLRLNAADPPTRLLQAEDPTCRGAREDPRTIDCKRDWIFDRCTTFAIEHEAAFEAIKGCTLEAELLIDYCGATLPGVNEEEGRGWPGTEPCPVRFSVNGPRRERRVSPRFAPLSRACARPEKPDFFL